MRYVHYLGLKNVCIRSQKSPYLFIYSFTYSAYILNTFSLPGTGKGGEGDSISHIYIHLWKWLREVKWLVEPGTKWQ